MPWMEVLGNDLYYVEAGRGEPLVFLHGMSSCGEAWWQQFEHFSSRYRVIAYDSVNHGHSSNSPRGEPETDRTDELEAVLSALEIDRPILAGNSMGGATILRPKTIEETAVIAGTVTRVTAPMLVIVGALDPLVPAAQRLHELVPHSQYVEVPDSPHNVYYETATEWNQAADGFLAER